MALDPLATVDDLRARNIPESEQDGLALRAASTVIRNAAENCIAEKTSTVTLPAPLGGAFLPLPGPVTDVALVIVDGTTWVAGDDYIVSPEGLTALRCWDWANRGVNITITFTHGLAEVPDDIIDLTCALAVRWKQAFDDGFVMDDAGVGSFRIDDYSETRTEESVDQVDPLWLPDKKKRELAARFNGGLVAETA